MEKSTAVYTSDHALDDITIEISRSITSRDAHKIVYKGLVPKGIAEIFYTIMSHALEVKFVDPISLEMLKDIAEEKGYKVNLGSVEPYEMRVYNHKGEFVRTEMQKPENPVFAIEEHTGIILPFDKPIIRVYYETPDTASVWSEDKFLRFHTDRGPISNKDAIEILEEYRREAYDISAH